jgi:oxygen-dependent protoporphyrinogen oxidase
MKENTMRGKLLILVGAAVGYAIGVKTGRDGFNKAKSKVTKVWESPQVQNTVDKAGDFAESKFPKATAKVKSAVDTVSEATSKPADPAPTPSAPATPPTPAA